ncbi:MAG TPA: hypothetical protein VER83_07625 [Candidatus Nanopelagicales bacterium]|nr:hypothetical protein [Candidatus Nanopelagicales bacterium]
MDPNDLDTRLAALEARAPGRDDPPELPRTRRRGLLATPLVLAPVLLLALVASAAAGGAVVATLVQSFPGVQNPGQPLEGANLECMSPPRAAAFLAERGFIDVVWQVETGDIEGKSGSTVQVATPPDHGYVIPGAILSDGKLYMVVDQRTGATGGGACPDLPMP